MKTPSISHRFPSPVAGRPLRLAALLFLALVIPLLQAQGEEATPAAADASSFEAALKRADGDFDRGYVRIAAPAYLECAKLRPDDPRAFHVKAAALFLLVEDDVGFKSVLEFAKSLDLSKAEPPVVARALWVAALAPGPLRPDFEAPWRRMEKQVAGKYAEQPADLLLLLSLIAYRNERFDDVLRIDEALAGKTLAAAQSATKLALKSAALSSQGKAREADQAYDSAAALVDLETDAPAESAWEAMFIAEELRKEARRAAIRRDGSPAKVPAAGTAFDVTTTYGFTHKQINSSAGEELGTSGFAMKLAADFHLEVLAADRLGITRAAYQVRSMSRKTDIKEEDRPQDEGDYAGLKGKRFIATASGDDIELRDPGGNPLPGPIEKAARGLFETQPLGGFYSLRLPQGNAPRPVTYDAGMRWMDFLPWRKLTTPGQSVAIDKEAASDLIKPAIDWTSSSIKKAELRCLSKEPVGGVVCLELELVIDASGPHREMFGGLPTVTTTALKARLLVEAETGWVRHFEGTNRIDQKSEGKFQEIPMKMNSTTDIHWKFDATPRRP